LKASAANPSGGFRHLWNRIQRGAESNRESSAPSGDSRRCDKLRTAWLNPRSLHKQTGKSPESGGKPVSLRHILPVSPHVRQR